MFTNSNEVFNQFNKKHFENLLNLVNEYKSIDKNYLLDNFSKTNSNLLNILFDRWYKSLEDNSPDYSVYSEDSYLIEAFNCWTEYSRRYLKLIKNYIKLDSCQIELNNIHTIMDIGCGIAYSTIALHNIFNNCTIYATNYKDSTQWIIDNAITSNFKSNIIMLDEQKQLSYHNNINIDIIVAFEFFEHIQKPIDFLNQLIYIYKPKYFIIANTFTQKAIGHFNYYLYNNIKYSGKEISKIFNNTLRNNNYEKIGTNFWNNRPTIWKLNNEVVSTSTVKSKKLF